MHAWNKMRAHFEQKHRQCQRRRQDRSSGDFTSLFFLAGSTIQRRIRLGNLGWITSLCSGFGKRRSIRCSLKVGNSGSLRREVNVHVENARHGGQRLVNAANAGRAGHRGDIERYTGATCWITRLVKCPCDFAQPFRRID